MSHFEIRKATRDDCSTLHDLAVTTFLETYSSVNSEENMQNYLSENYSEEQLTLEMDNPFSEFYLAFLAQKAIGFLKINFGEAQTELKDNQSLEIERIYVLSEFHGKKIGQLLFDKALEIARAHQSKYVWLGVWEQNSKAIRFYQKNGLTEFDNHIFKLGSEEQIDILMKIELQ